jgi:hypothetical protein
VLTVLPRSLGLQMRQERADQRGVQVGDVQLSRVDASGVPSEVQQQLEGVTVGGDRVRVGLALPGQPVGEERLQDGSQPAQDNPAWACSSRCAANDSSSGAAWRYQ